MKIGDAFRLIPIEPAFNNLTVSQLFKLIKKPLLELEDWQELSIAEIRIMVINEVKRRIDDYSDLKESCSELISELMESKKLNKDLKAQITNNKRDRENLSPVICNKGKFDPLKEEKERKQGPGFIGVGGNKKGEVEKKKRKDTYSKKERKAYNEAYREKNKGMRKK